MRGKLRITSIMLVLILLLGTFGLAVPSITVSVQRIGVGSQRLVSPVLQGSIWFNTGLTAGELVFSGDLRAGTRVHISLRDANNNTIAYNYSIVLTSDLVAGTVLRYSLVNPSGATRVNVVKAVVTVLTPNYQTTFTSGNILVTSRELGVGIANTTVFCTPIIVKENSGQTLYNYSVLVVLDDSANTNSEAWSVDWNVINATNLYFTDNAGNPLYFWVQSMDTNNRIAYLWVKLPILAAGSSSTLCLNYGVWPNPYSVYHDLYRTFLFVDDFNNFSTATWESNVPVTVNNGILELFSGQWIWTRRTFGRHYAVHFVTYLNYEGGTKFNNAPNTNNLYYSLGPFFMGYIAPDNTAYAEGVGGRYRLFFGWPIRDSEAKGLLTFGLPNDPDVTGYWDASRTNNQYNWRIPIYGTMTLYNGQLKFYQKPVDGNWGNVSTYTQMSSYVVTVTGDGRIGLGQWSGGPSYYGWVVVRNYVDPEPSVSIGYWYYGIVFYPQPSTVSTASSLVSPLVTGVITPLSIGLNDATLVDKRTFLPPSPPTPQNNTLLLQMGNITEERIKELASNLTLPSNGS